MADASGAAAGAGDASADAGSTPLLPKEVSDLLTAEAVAYASANGIMMGDAMRGYKHAPFALLPFKYDRATFEQSQALAKPFSAMVDAISRDTEWLTATLGATGKSDEFTGRLMQIFDAVNKEGVAQPLSLGLHRSDYMIDNASGRLMQVELNTIASAFGGLSTRLAALHRQTLRRFAPDHPSIFSALGVDATPEALDAALPANKAVEEMAAAIADAHRLYGNPDAVVLFVVQPGEQNATDQRLLQYQLWEAHGISVMRMTLEQLATLGSVDETTRAFTVPRGCDADASAGSATETVEVAVGYLRAGYTPNDYPSEVQWDGRLALERSKAIKCPNIAYHLVGTKKVQQALASPGAVERFLGAEDSAAVRASFAGLWALDGSDTSEEHAAALKKFEDDPTGFVLKPQREGGGNNFYGAAALKEYRRLTPERREGFILMARIFPKDQASCLVSKGTATVSAAVAELGIYGTFLGDGSTTHRNSMAGHLVRTKQLGVDEGGVASGYAVLNSPILL